MTFHSTRPVEPIVLYRHPLSGHCHRVELFLSLLELPYRLVDVDLLAKEQKQPAFLKLNPFGQIPVIQDGEVVLADANAILVYLAKRYGNGDWLPEDAIGAAQVQRWFSVAAGPLAFGPATARLVKLFNVPFNHDEASRRAVDLFVIIEQHLQTRQFLLGEKLTVADIANYSYTALAPEGGISLEPFPALRAWLARIEMLPGFVPMTRAQAHG
jgi:glutathione S-transferase